MKTKLLNLYGDIMVSIGVWFMKRGEKYATWVEFNLDNGGWDDCKEPNCDKCHCSECD